MGTEPRPNGVAYWRGTVDAKLESLEEKIDSVDNKIDALSKKVDALGDSDSPFVTWAYIRNKFTAPVTLAMITFFLFTIMPSIFVLIYFLPRLAELSR